MRVLIGKALQLHYKLPDESDPMEVQRFHKLNCAIPRVSFIHEDEPMEKCADQLATDKSIYSAARIIFLSRDPRDVVVSAYFARTKRPSTNRGCVYDGTLHAFIREPVGSFDTVLHYYNIWAAQRSRCGAFHLVRYEDLHNDTEVELAKLLSFVGVSDVSPQSVMSAVEFGRFENMRRLELSQQHSIRLRPEDPHDPESYKTRKGIVGGFREYLNESDIQYLSDRMRLLDSYFGYPASE